MSEYRWRNKGHKKLFRLDGVREFVELIEISPVATFSCGQGGSLRSQIVVHHHSDYRNG